MTRVKLIKDMIRMGMRFVPNHLLAYRFFSLQGHWLFQLPPGFHAHPGQVAGLQALWLSHESRCQPRVLLYLHGGGYVIGSNQTHLELACRIAEAAEAQVFMLEYRLAPENPYPAALDDALFAYRYLLSQGVRHDQIIIAGDSAGGGLALATVMRLRDLGMPMPAAAVGLSPWLDLSCELSAVSPRQQHDPLMTHQRIKHFADHYAQQTCKRDPGLSPFFGELEGLPPCLVQVGGDEILLCEARAFHARAEAQGASVELQIWPDMFHVWHFAARILPESHRAIEAIGEFIQRQVPVFQRPSTETDAFKAA
ncbi:MAG: alpha/beta hydrolase [Hahellaceae bacterium]|nr:alpha/beta hydrolase [Hahellaceae bacterium]